VGRKPQSKLMSRRTERPYKADGTDKLAPHSKAPCSVPEVNGPVAQQEFTSLLREICAPSTPATEGAAVREDRREGAEVSRGHSTGGHEPATKKPEGLTTREGLNLAGSTTIAGRRLALKPKGGAGPRASVAEKECCSILRDCQEPPDADPHVRWCGGREVNPPGYPIRPRGRDTKNHISPEK
jgi:hypothetical protein